MPTEIPLKMPQRGPSALGIGLYVALALCLAAPSRARADAAPSYDDDALLVLGLGMTVITSWVVFAVIDIEAASDHRPLSSELATVEMLFHASEHSAGKPAPKGTRPPAPRPGHFNVAFNPDPHSPRATLSVTF